MIKTTRYYLNDAQNAWKSLSSPLRDLYMGLTGFLQVYCFLCSFLDPHNPAENLTLASLLIGCYTMGCLDPFLPPAAG